MDSNGLDDPTEAVHGFHGARQLHKGTHNEYHFNIFISTDAKKNIQRYITHTHIYIYIHIYIYTYICVCV